MLLGVLLWFAIRMPEMALPKLVCLESQVDVTNLEFLILKKLTNVYCLSFFLVKRPKIQSFALSSGLF